jgi:hypothetical protein
MKKITIFLSLFVVLALSGASVASASAGPPEEALVQEAAAEAAEVSEEAAEDAAEAAAARTFAISAKRPASISAKRLASYARRIGQWKTLIARVRARKRELLSRPLTSKVRQIWLPRKRALLKEYRKHLRLLRAEILEKEKLL